MLSVFVLCSYIPLMIKSIRDSTLCPSLLEATHLYMPLCDVFDTLGISYDAAFLKLFKDKMPNVFFLSLFLDH